MVGRVIDHRLQTIHRFRAPETEADRLRSQVGALLDQWRASPGWLDGDLLRNLDDSDLWVLTSRWVDVGAYRRYGLGGPARMLWMPVMAWVIDEPSAYLSPDALE